MKRIKMVGVALPIMAISLAAWLWSGSGSIAIETKQVENTQLAPSWELQNLDGETVHSSDFEGKLVVLDFWAAWCPPGRAEIPGFIELQKRYQARGLVVVGISVDQAGAETVKSFAKKLGINYPVVLTDTNIVAAYGGIDGLPTTFVIDRTGRIVKRHLGFTEELEIESEIKSLLNP
jgi:peroxiredoxin